MNYIMEIRLFYDRLELTPLPPTAIALWHAVMYLANKSGWPQEIFIPASTLEARSGLERRAVYRARDVLREAGLVDFRERSGNQCAVYSINSLTGLLYNSDTQSVTQGDASEPENGDDDADCSTDLSHSVSRKCGELYENDTQNVTQVQPPEDVCSTDLSHKVSHKEGLLCNSDTQSVPQTELCCTDLSHSVSPLDKQNISLDKDKKINKGGLGEKKKPVKPPKKKEERFDLSFIGDEAWAALVSSWLEYKRSRNESYKSDLSVKKFHTMLRNLSRGDPAIARRIIDKSIANNWAGIFELTENDSRPRGQPATGQRIGQIKQPEDEERRRKLLEKFGGSNDAGKNKT